MASQPPQPQFENDDNDLQRFFNHLPEWWDKWGTWVIVVLIVITAGVWLRKYTKEKAVETHERIWGDLSKATSPKELRVIAEENREHPAGALAFQRAGDLFLQDATFPKTDAPTTSPATAPAKNDPKRSLEDAEAMYKAAINAPRADTLIKLNAQLGLAAVAEAKQDLDAARAIYKQVIDAAAGNDGIKRQATTRLAMLDRLALPVVFAPEPPPATQPVSSGDVSLPPALIAAPSISATPEPAPAKPSKPAPKSDKPAAPVKK